MHVPFQFCHFKFIISSLVLFLSHSRRVALISSFVNFIISSFVNFIISAPSPPHHPHPPADPIGLLYLSCHLISLCSTFYGRSRDHSAIGYCGEWVVYLHLNIGDHIITQ